MVFVPGHFGEWLQGRLGPEGPVALITMACPARGVRASRAPGGFALDGDPLLSEAQARGLLRHLGLPEAGRYSLRADCPPGGGAGMSTAALVALARAARAAAEGAAPVGVGCASGRCPPQGAAAPEAGALAAACLAAEGASDPLMLAQPDAVLWAPRAARVLAALPPPPRAEVVGGFWGPPQRTDPADLAFPDVSDLVAAWRQGPGLAEAAALASASARRTTAMRGPAGDPTAALAEAAGAAGFARAHTGSARALIFAPGRVPPGLFELLAEAGLTGLCRFTTGGAP
jgi:uncharacterized protein involved in propanediol utilization